jgi:hypothetical protein
VTGDRAEGGVRHMYRLDIITLRILRRNRSWP